MDPLYVMEYARRQLKCPHLINNSQVQQSRLALKERIERIICSASKFTSSPLRFPESLAHKLTRCRGLQDHLGSHSLWTLCLPVGGLWEALQFNCLNNNFIPIAAHILTRNTTEVLAWPMYLSKCVTLVRISMFVLQCGNLALTVMWQFPPA